MFKAEFQNFRSNTYVNDLSHQAGFTGVLSSKSVRGVVTIVLSQWEEIFQILKIKFVAGSTLSHRLDKFFFVHVGLKMCVIPYYLTKNVVHHVRINKVLVL